jgi:hypothetical protein
MWKARPSRLLCVRISFKKVWRSYQVACSRDNPTSKLTRLQQSNHFCLTGPPTKISEDPSLVEVSKLTHPRPSVKSKSCAKGRNLLPNGSMTLATALTNTLFTTKFNAHATGSKAFAPFQPLHVGVVRGKLSVAPNVVNV